MWGNHYVKVFKKQDQDSDIGQQKEQLEGEVNEEKIKKEEFQEAIRRIRLGKVARVNNITPEMIKYRGSSY